LIPGALEAGLRASIHPVTRGKIMAHPDFPPFLVDKQPIERVLQTLEFEPYDLGYRREWGLLELTACEAINCWFLVRSYSTPREIGWPYEIRIEANIAPIELMAIIYRLWAEAHPGTETHDAYLVWGKEWIDYKREMKSLIPRPPTVWAEREFLRYCLTYIERQHDWIDADYEIRFSQVSGQIKITANNTEVYCPAHGNWVGESVVQAKELFRSLPKRFMGNVVMLQALGDKIGIDNRKFKARWVDREAV
jgi:hypothetical protein